MNRKTLTTVALIGLALVGLMLWGRVSGVPTDPQQEVGAKSALSAAETAYDFGVITMRGGNVSHVFKVANPTDQDITVERLSTSCMCTTAYIVEGTSRAGPFGMPGMGFAIQANRLFRAGQAVDIEVVFDPNAHGPAGVGPMERFALLTDTSGGVLQLEINGLVRP